MADTDVILRLYPFDDVNKKEEMQNARKAITNPENTSRYMPPMAKPLVPDESYGSQSSRASTQPPEETREAPLDEFPYLEVRFSEGPRTSAGLVFGTDSACDVILPRIRGISKRHFALTYKISDFSDGCYRLIVRDLGSKYGTRVTYDGDGDELRSGFDWVINGFHAPDIAERLIVQPHEDLSFRAIVMRHDITSPVYIANVERFRQGSADPEDLVDGLELQSGLTTERHSGSHTPVIESPIVITVKDIAQGGFGSVSHQWNVSTGEDYASKRPLGKYSRAAWKNEIDIMRRVSYESNSHDHIVRLCFWDERPDPCLYLEYMPLGNLGDQHNIVHLSDNECLAVLSQTSSALTYLHGLQQPVVHRDIKPENILVQTRNFGDGPNSLHVKLSDFGLSKSGSLKTFCGTRTYWPPEVREQGVPYTTAVDIWSLGVVVLRFSYGLPHPGSGMGMMWCKSIVQEALNWESNGLIDVLQRMLVINADVRYSATDCWREASQLAASSLGRSATPTPASYATQHAPYVRSGAPGPSTNPSAGPSPRPRRRKHNKPTSSQRTDSQSDMNYDGCWMDPLHPFGGGSSLVKMEQQSPTSIRATQSLGAPVDLDDEFTPLDWMQPKEGALLQNPADPFCPHPAAGGGNSVHENFVDCNIDGGVPGTATYSDHHLAEALLREIMAEDENHGRGDAHLGTSAASDVAANDRHAGSPPYQLGIVPNEEERVHPPGETEDRAPVPPISQHKQGSPIRRRRRTSPEDKAVLEAAYLRNPNASKRSHLSIIGRVSMTEKQVQVWFQNRRQRDRRGREG